MSATSVPVRDASDVPPRGCVYAVAVWVIYIGVHGPAADRPFSSLPER